MPGCTFWRRLGCAQTHTRTRTHPNTPVKDFPLPVDAPLSKNHVITLVLAAGNSSPLLEKHIASTARRCCRPRMCAQCHEHIWGMRDPGLEKFRGTRHSVVEYSTQVKSCILQSVVHVVGTNSCLLFGKAQHFPHIATIWLDLACSKLSTSLRISPFARSHVLTTDTRFKQSVNGKGGNQIRLRRFHMIT